MKTLHWHRPQDFGGALPGEDIEECTARTLYDVDEDIADEACVLEWTQVELRQRENSFPRIAWSELNLAIQASYRRRARASIAAAELWLAAGQ